MTKFFIGGCEWRLQEATTPRLKKQLHEGADHTKVNGRCFPGDKVILVAQHDNRQERYETIVHEGIHAICYEHAHFKPFADIFNSEELTHILTKSIIGFQRQLMASEALAK